MDGNLMIGTELLDYAADMYAVVLELEEALELAREVRKSLIGGEAYQGDALESMEMFTKHLIENIEKLQLLYEKGGAYTYNTYETMYQSDAAMAAWMLRQIKTNGGGGR